jgi:hypothetical protein
MSNPSRNWINIFMDHGLLFVKPLRLRPCPAVACAKGTFWRDSLTLLQPGELA